MRPTTVPPPVKSRGKAAKPHCAKDILRVIPAI
jgi:hypothetical protein